MVRPDPLIVPPGGHYFQERRGVTLRADSFEKLVDLVLEYRIANRLPVGDPEGEVAEVICTRAPDFCTDRIGRSKSLSDVELPARVLAWSLGQYERRRGQSGLVSASPELAARRAEICRKCPAARRMGRGPCDTQVVSLRLALTKSADHPGLGYCSIFRHDNATAAYFLDRPEENPEAPAECWRTKQP